MVKISRSLGDTRKITGDFLKKIKRGRAAAVVGLYGELGAGKTAFIQAAGRHLGVKSKMASPTFVLMKKYAVKKGQHKFLHHFDMYRLKDAKELKNLGWAEIIADPRNIVFIEWPERIKKAMPRHHKIFISHLRHPGRKFRIVSGPLS